MNTAFFIARRYFFSKKKKNLINIISNISMIGVAVSTMALLVVLSVFNGLEELTMSLYASHHPQIQVTAKRGKAFPVNDSLLQVLKKIQGVQEITEVIEDNALLRYGEMQTVVNVKGVSGNFARQYDLESKLVSGKFMIRRDSTPYALIGIGIQMQLSVSLQDDMKPLVFWYPKKQRSVQLDPTKAFTRKYILASGILAIEQQFDHSYVIVPLEFANDLMNYGNARTSLEIKTDSLASRRKIQVQIEKRLGSNFTVKNIEEQQESVLRAVKIERLFVFIAFSIILAIASFNIFFSLAMLAIEKQKDIAILLSMGADQKLIRNIFLIEGSMIAFIGAFTGLVLGFTLCYLQKQFGFVELGVESSVIQYYPVKLVWTDFAAISGTVIIVTVLASYIPAKNATRVKVSEQV